ncbi:hypothetical protein M8818_004600 [Zalaria obscura]|uniref:Uncharacterized protein n=1 Tax=Zalaria obscura TaxID=2024903 RepID=A0ACC3SDC5_9PEZI
MLWNEMLSEEQVHPPDYDVDREIDKGIDHPQSGLYPGRTYGRTNTRSRSVLAVAALPARVLVSQSATGRGQNGPSTLQNAAPLSEPRDDPGTRCRATASAAGTALLRCTWSEEFAKCPAPVIDPAPLGSPADRAISVVVRTL